MALDLASFLGAGEQQLADNSEARIQVSDFMRSAGQGIFDQQQLVRTDAKGNTPLEVQMAELAKLEEQNRTQTIGYALGLNPDLTADVQVQLATRRSAAMQQALVQQDKVAKMQSVGLFDNPIEHIINSVLLPDEMNKLKSTQSVVDFASQQLNQIAADTTAASNTSKLISTKTSQALIDDQIAASQAELESKRIGIGVEGDLKMAHAVKELNQMSQQDLSVRGAMLNAQNSAESMAMQRAARAEAKQLHSLQAQKYQDENERIAYIADTINVARKEEGKPLVDPRMFKNVWGTNTTVGKELLGDYERGTAYVQKLPVVASETLTGRVQTLGTLPPQSFPTDASKRLATAQLQSIEEAMVTNKGAKPEVIEAEAARIFDSKMKDWQLNVNPKNQENPFSLLSTGSYDQAKAVRDTAAWKLYRSVNTVDEAMDVNKFLQNAAANIRAGKLDYRDAVAAVKAIGEYSIQQNDTLNKTYFITGERQSQLQVPIEVVSTGQVLARYAAATAGVAATGVALTGVGLPAAAGLGAASVGLGAMSAGKTTKLLPITNSKQIEYALMQMVTAMPSQGK